MSREPSSDANRARENGPALGDAVVAPPPPKPAPKKKPPRIRVEPASEPDGRRRVSVTSNLWSGKTETRRSEPLSVEDRVAIEMYLKSEWGVE